MQASAAPRVPIVHVDFRLCHDRGEPVLATPAMELRIHDPEEEIALGAQPSEIVASEAYFKWKLRAGMNSLVSACGAWFK